MFCQPERRENLCVACAVDANTLPSLRRMGASGPALPEMPHAHFNVLARPDPGNDGSGAAGDR
jgi:hypothetical protein